MIFTAPNCVAMLLACAFTGFAAPSTLQVQRADFGVAKSGEKVEMFTLTNTNGVRLQVITYGAIIYSLETPDRNGNLTNITANRETLADYEARSAAFGAVLGRYANRIGNARFSIDGTEYKLTPNAGKNHIHGGRRGFDKVVWSGFPRNGEDSAAVRLNYTSKDGEDGYPGNLQVSVVYELNNQNELKIHYTAVSDKTTHVNLSNHAYWNLAGAYSGDVLGHVLALQADKFLAVDDALIPTGEFRDVAGTPLDFRAPHRVGERIKNIQEKHFNGGYDHCFVLRSPATDKVPVLCARVEDPTSGRVMEVLTAEPGVQLYTANFGPGAFEGPRGYSYPRHLGLCLETQHFPDSPNKPNFPSTLLKAGATYSSLTIHKFSVAK